MFVAGCIAALAADAAIQLLYGSEFRPAGPAFLWLLPGLVCLSVHTICMNYFASRGFPTLITLAPVGGLLVNVMLNLWMIPRIGIVGASLASSAAYAAMLLISGPYLLRDRRSPRSVDVS
jgi:O-antigen/teichoic acid export membrane protein